jgi:hypothetical protein
MIFPKGILRLRQSVLDEAQREGPSLFRAVADVGPNPIRLATLEWMAGQSSLVTNPTSRVLAEKMIQCLATDTEPNILIRATSASLAIPPPFTASPALLSNTLARTTERVQVLATEHRPMEVRDILFRLRDVIDEKTFQATLGQDQYETLVRQTTSMLWPLTTQDVVYESASWVLEKFNSPVLNDKFYLRATDETKYGRSSTYDQRVLFINRPPYLRNRVIGDCEAILQKWTTSFAERNGTTNPPALREGADAFFQRNDFLLKLAASYGEFDLVDRAARHENKWYHELAERARNAFPKRKDKESPNNGTEPIR